MKIVVTGAAGLLGNATAKHLLAKGYEVFPRKQTDIQATLNFMIFNLGISLSSYFCGAIPNGAKFN